MQIRKILVSLLLTLVAVLPLAAQNNPKKVAVWETKCSNSSVDEMNPNRSLGFLGAVWQ